MTKRNVKTAIPFLADHFTDDDVVFDFDSYAKLLKNNRDRLGGFEKYTTRLHDSWVIDLCSAGDTLVLKLNDFDTHIFADVIVDAYNIAIDHDKLVFPLEIVFSGDIAWKTYSVEDGDMTETGVIGEYSEYLYEQVLEVDAQRIKIAFVLWTESNAYEVMEVAANQLLVKEHQLEAWQTVFEGKYTAELDFFKEIRFDEYHSLGFDYCKKLFEQFKAGNRKTK